MIRVFLEQSDFLQTILYVERMDFVKNVKLIKTEQEEEGQDIPKERVKMNPKYVVHQENVNYLHVNITRITDITFILILNRSYYQFRVALKTS